jgi:hypothetical protein
MKKTESRKSRDTVPLANTKVNVTYPHFLQLESIYIVGVQFLLQKRVKNDHYIFCHEFSEPSYGVGQWL